MAENILLHEGVQCNCCATRMSNQDIILSKFVFALEEFEGGNDVFEMVWVFRIAQFIWRSG